MEPLRQRAGRARAAEVREGAHVWCVRSHVHRWLCGRETVHLIVLQKKRCTGVAGWGSPLLTSGGERVPVAAENESESKLWECTCTGVTTPYDLLHPDAFETTTPSSPTYYTIYQSARTIASTPVAVRTEASPGDRYLVLQGYRICRVITGTTSALS